MRIYKKVYKDITGKTFNWLTALRYLFTRSGRAVWLFKCKCGNEKELRAKDVRTGNTKSCGCRKKQRGPDVDLAGKKYHYLTVISCLGKKQTSDYWWKCKCDCGGDNEVSTSTLNKGRIKSCGCLKPKFTSEFGRKQSGKNHPSFDHSISQEERELNRNERRWSNPKLNRWRTKVYKRDQYKCLKCGIEGNGTNLRAHHIYSWHSHKKLRYITNNGITLCRDCHKNFHHRYGNKNNNRKQINDFVSYTGNLL